MLAWPNLGPRSPAPLLVCGGGGGESSESEDDEGEGERDMGCCSCNGGEGEGPLHSLEPVAVGLERGSLFTGAISPPADIVHSCTGVSLAATTTTAAAAAVEQDTESQSDEEVDEVEELQDAAEDKLVDEEEEEQEEEEIGTAGFVEVGTEAAAANIAACSET